MISAIQDELHRKVNYGFPRPSTGLALASGRLKSLAFEKASGTRINKRSGRISARSSARSSQRSSCKIVENSEVSPSADKNSRIGKVDVAKVEKNVDAPETCRGQQKDDATNIDSDVESVLSSSLESVAESHFEGGNSIDTGEEVRTKHPLNSGFKTTIKGVREDGIPHAYKLQVKGAEEVAVEIAGGVARDVTGVVTGELTQEKPRSLAEAASEVVPSVPREETQANDTQALLSKNERTPNLANHVSKVEEQDIKSQRANSRQPSFQPSPRPHYDYAMEEQALEKEHARNINQMQEKGQEGNAVHEEQEEDQTQKEQPRQVEQVEHIEQEENVEKNEYVAPIEQSIHAQQKKAEDGEQEEQTTRVAAVHDKPHGNAGTKNAVELKRESASLEAQASHAPFLPQWSLQNQHELLQHERNGHYQEEPHGKSNDDDTQCTKQSGRGGTRKRSSLLKRPHRDKALVEVCCKTIFHHSCLQNTKRTH